MKGTPSKLFDLIRSYRAGRSDREGVSLRDYLAAHCPLTLDEFRARYRHSDAAQVEAGFAEARYRYADAMLRARG